jgi:hypothetical protein
MPFAQTSPTSNHMGLFTEIEGKNQKTRERDACDPVAELAALVEAMAARKCSTCQIVEAVRRFASEASATRQASADAQETAPVWIALGSPEWRAWAAFYRATKGKTPPEH